MSKKFPYGYDIDKYIDKVFEKLKKEYPWATRDMLRKEYVYAIEKIDSKYHFVIYNTNYKGEDGKDVRDDYAEKFIDYVFWLNSYNVEDANEVEETFKVPFDCGTDAHGWCLEQYDFRKHTLGGYSAFVQAGDRTTGGSRTFFIPDSFFEGTYDEFLDQYCDMVPGGAFGLYKSDLLNTPGLKEFLGF